MATQSLVQPPRSASPADLYEALFRLTEDYNRLISTGKIEDDAITAAKIAGGTITTTEIANGTILNTDISASAAIDLSKLATPAWNTWSTTYGGFSTPPTQALRYIKIGRIVTLLADVNGATGTSNATSFTMSLPFAAAREVRYGGIWALNNTSTTSFGRADTGVGSSTLTFYTAIDGTLWTASGSKGVSFCITYESTS